MGFAADENLERAFGPICERADAGCTPERRRVLEEIIQLAVEIAREGRFRALAEGAPFAELDAFFREDRRRRP